jgi:hypothetical protein
MSMTESEINRVCTDVKQGARMLVGRDHAGRQKLKVVKGPFGLFVKRYECSEADISVIRTKLNPAVNKRAAAGR